MTRELDNKDRAAIAFLWAVQVVALAGVLAVGVVAILNPWLLPALEAAAETMNRYQAKP